MPLPKACFPGHTGPIITLDLSYHTNQILKLMIVISIMVYGMPLVTQLLLKHLALIAAITEHGQISLAAHALAITQPAASRTLAEAEARIGAVLFVRHPKGMSPTAIGETLARRARNILDELADATDEVDRLREGRGGIVRIGAVTGAAVGYVAPAIRALRGSAASGRAACRCGNQRRTDGGACWRCAMTWCCAACHRACHLRHSACARRAAKMCASLPMPTTRRPGTTRWRWSISHRMNG